MLSVLIKLFFITGIKGNKAEVKQPGLATTLDLDISYLFISDSP